MAYYLLGWEPGTRCTNTGTVGLVLQRHLSKLGQTLKTIKSCTTCKRNISSTESYQLGLLVQWAAQVESWTHRIPWAYPLLPKVAQPTGGWGKSDWKELYLNSQATHQGPGSLFLKDKTSLTWKNKINICQFGWIAKQWRIAKQNKKWFTHHSECYTADTGKDFMNLGEINH